MANINYCVLGGYMARVFSAQKTLLDPALRALESVIYRVCGVDARKDQTWVEWASAMLAVNGAGLLVLYAILRLQGMLPLNPDGLGAEIGRAHV